tara:strand:+ start:1300 stop:1857 length:558 start_codon:yes stop_codon:yes gene_type:complete
MKLGKNSFINKFSNAYSKKSCNSLIDWFEKNKHLSEPGGAGDKLLNNLEICIRIKPENNYFNLDKTLFNCTKKFKKIYPEVDKHLGRWNIDPYMQLACYEPNNFYNYIHCENDGDPKYINRVFAWMIFLNTIEKGGGTYFKYQNITAKPVAGDLYIWPAGWTHFHQGVKAPKEKKYILTGWYNYI